MRLFTRDKTRAVQSFLLKVVNNHCPEVAALIEGPRLESRVNLTVVVVVVPVEDGQPVVEKAFTAVTKEFSTAGIALVLDQPTAISEVIVGFRGEGQMTFLRATAKHLNPIGGGFYQLGLQLIELVYAGDFPDLEELYL